MKYEVGDILYGRGDDKYSPYVVVDADEQRFTVAWVDEDDTKRRVTGTSYKQRDKPYYWIRRAVRGGKNIYIKHEFNFGDPVVDSFSNTPGMFLEYDDEPDYCKVAFNNMVGGVTTETIKISLLKAREA